MATKIKNTLPREEWLTFLGIRNFKLHQGLFVSLTPFFVTHTQYSKYSSCLFYSHFETVHSAWDSTPQRKDARIHNLVLLFGNNNNLAEQTF
jgi:hypothetical protein